MTKKDVSWDLSPLFDSIDDPKINTLIKETEGKIETFVKKYKNNIKNIAPNQIKDACEELESILTPLYNIKQYSSLLYSKDTSKSDVKQFQQRIDFLFSELYNKLLFFDLELGAISKKQYNNIIKSSSVVNYNYYIKQIYKQSLHNLSEKEEKIVNLKNITGIKALRKIYTDLTSSFQFEFELDGQIKTMNASELRNLRYHEDKDVRRRAMKLFFERYEDNSLVISHIYNAIIEDQSIEKNLRKYKSSISVMNTANDLSDETVDNLIQMTGDSYHLVESYYKIKADILGLDDMTPADIYAPIYPEKKEYSWSETKDIVLESFASFDEEFFQIAKSMFDEHRIDAFVSKYKRGGAFCSASSPDKKPYVLLNFLGKHRDVATLAHELGHAIHDVFASKQTLINYHPILPLAETASVFSEMIVTDFLLKQETDINVKKSIITSKLEDIFATSHRQNMFSTFELKNHGNIESKSFIPAEELCLVYEEELRSMFGDSLLYPDEYAWEWASIPHIFEVPFYVYSYNFANLLVITLYQRYLDEGKSFSKKLKNFLSMGASKNPIEIARTVDADLTDKDFWSKGILYIEGLINELKGLIK